MTRKQRQSGNESHNFNTPRDRAAFQALLAREEDEEESDAQKCRKNGPARPAAKPKREKEKFFALKQQDSEPAARSEAADMQQLAELFDGAADPELQAAVYQQVGGNLPAAVDALVAILGGTSEPSAAAGCAGAGAGATSSSSSSSSASTPGAEGEDAASWGLLPEDIKAAVMARLRLREMAQAAGVCRDWAARVRQAQAAVTRLVLPPGLSYTAVKGCIRACSGASVLDLTRLERRGPRTTTSNPSARGQVAKLQRQEAEAEAFRVVVALAEVLQGCGRPVPVRGLALAGLQGITDNVVAEVLRGVSTLRTLDMCHCPNITSQSLLLLSKYKGVTAAAAAAAAAGGGPPGDGGRTGSSPAPHTHPSSSSSSRQRDSSSPQPQQSSAGDSSGSSSSNLAIHRPVAAGVMEAMTRQLSAAGLASDGVSAPLAHDRHRAAGAGGLHAVLLAGNAQLADHGVAALLSGAATRPALQQLDVSHCTALTSDALQLPPTGVLEQLTAQGLGAGFKALTLQLPASHPLTVLDLSGCAYLRELNLVTPHLTALHINKAATLHRLRLSCPRLTHISATHCSQLAVLYSDAWSTPALVHLNLFGCCALHQVHHVLGACNELRSLNCNGCTSMTQLLLRDQPALQDVEVSGCSRLLVLEVASPLLRRCQASACGQLQRLVLETQRLAQLVLTNCSCLRSVCARPPPRDAEHAAAAAAAAGDDQPRQLSLRGCDAMSEVDRTMLQQLVGAGA